MARLRIATPCDASWEEMPARSAGRFCERCAKDVVDLSRLTERDALVLAAMLEPGTLCGRLRHWADGTARHAPLPALPRHHRGTALAVALSAAVVGCHGAPPPVPPPSHASAPESDPSNDRDHDGLPDRLDLCPDAPEDRDGFEDDDGCPDPDNDRDRIVDAQDKCPNEPETFNGYEDEDGCPDRGGGIMIESEVKILDTIEFGRGSAKVLPASAASLTEIARVLRDNPELGTLIVHGHARADERGSKDLAKKRADNVVASLVDKGADAKRVEARADEPAGDSTRVTFEIAPQMCALPDTHAH